MIQFRTRVLPTARIHAMHQRFPHHCHAGGGDVPKSMDNILLEYPRLEDHRRSFGTLAPTFNNGFLTSVHYLPVRVGNG
jgi:hypothetical protein